MIRYPVSQVDGNVEIDGYNGGKDLIYLGPLGNDVRDALGVAMALDDSKGKISNCLKMAHELTFHVYDAQEFSDDANGHIANVASEIAGARLAKHGNMLRNQQMILGDSVAVEWFSIRHAGDATTAMATDTLQTLKPGEIVDRSWLDLLLGEDSENIMNGPFMDDPANETIRLAVQVERLIPDTLRQTIRAIKTGIPIVTTTTSGNSKKLLNDREALALKQELEKSFTLDRPLTKKIGSRLINLEELLERFVYEPDKVFAEGVVNACDGEIHSLVDGFVDTETAEKHSAYFTPPTKKQKRNKRKIEYNKRQAAIDGTAQDTEKTRSDDTPVLLERTETGKELVQVGETMLDFPWLDGPQELSVQKLDGRANNVCVVRAQEPKIVDIREVTDQKLAEGALDAIVLQRARSLGEGIMPFQDGAVRKLKNSKSEMREQYKGMTIWYTYDIGPNTTRVYFSVQPAPKSLDSDDSKSDLMLVVLAETDKANQTKVLQRFTTLSRKSIINNGSGSI